MSKTRLGELREVVTIEYDVEAEDGQGGRTRTPATLAADVPAAVRGSSAGDEALQHGDAVTSQVRYEVELAYRPDVTEKMRLHWTPYLGAATVLEVLGVRPKDGRVDRLLLDCVRTA